jgi:hypothetical protein
MSMSDRQLEGPGLEEVVTALCTAAVILGVVKVRDCSDDARRKELKALYLAERVSEGGALTQSVQQRVIDTITGPGDSPFNYSDSLARKADQLSNQIEAYATTPLDDKPEIVADIVRSIGERSLQMSKAIEARFYERLNSTINDLATSVQKKKINFSEFLGELESLAQHFKLLSYWDCAVMVEDYDEDWTRFATCESETSKRTPGMDIAKLQEHHDKLQELIGLVRAIKVMQEGDLTSTEVQWVLGRFQELVGVENCIDANVIDPRLHTTCLTALMDQDAKSYKLDSQDLIQLLEKFGGKAHLVARILAGFDLNGDGELSPVEDLDQDGDIDSRDDEKYKALVRDLKAKMGPEVDPSKLNFYDLISVMIKEGLIAPKGSEKISQLQGCPINTFVVERNGWQFIALDAVDVDVLEKHILSGNKLLNGRPTNINTLNTDLTKWKKLPQETGGRWLVIAPEEQGGRTALLQESRRGEQFEPIGFFGQAQSEMVRGGQATVLGTKHREALIDLMKEPQFRRVLQILQEFNVTP